MVTRSGPCAPAPLVSRRGGIANLIAVHGAMRRRARSLPASPKAGARLVTPWLPAVDGALALRVVCFWRGSDKITSSEPVGRFRQGAALIHDQRRNLPWGSAAEGQGLHLLFAPGHGLRR